MATYTVRAGDSLSQIAAKLGISWRDLYAANTNIIGSNPDLIKAGQVLTVPGGTTTPATNPPAVPSGAWEGGDANDLIQVPEPSQAQVWYNSQTKKFYLAWQVPGTDVPLLYEVMDPKVIVGTGKTLRADWTGTTAAFNQRGAMVGGTTYELANTNDHPFSFFESQVKARIEVEPWLADEEVLGVYLQAILEGRSPEPAELRGTEWYQTHGPNERLWLEMSAADPVEAARVRADNRLFVEGLLKARGVNNASSQLIGWMADQYTQGLWSKIYVERQALAIADPYARIPIDAKLKAQMTGVLDVTHEREEEVKTTAREWLGPAYGNWDQAQIASWAGQLRNDPDAEQKLSEMLSKQRLAMFPTYTDSSLTYEDIASPWRSVVREIWGELPDEKDPLFTQILRLNDQAEASKLLRKEGLARNNGKVVQDLQRALGTAQGGGVRRAIG